MNIAKQFQSHVTTQKYGQKTTIDGVEMKQLPFLNDDGGNFTELFRISDGFVEGLATPFPARQMSASIVLPGAIKAFHLHYKQDDLWYVSPTDRLLVNLFDIREDSPTFQTHIRLVLGGGKNVLLRIPAGVAHGVANIYSQPMTLLYATSNQFDLAAPDEHRLPWDHFGANIWEMTKG